MFKNKNSEAKKDASKLNPNYKSYRVSQKAVLYNPKDRTYLIVKGSQDDTKFYKTLGPWEFVGGRIERDEKINESFTRELIEEIGDINYKLGKPVGTMEFEVDENTITLIIGYLTIYESGKIKISDEHSEYKWETAENIEKNKEYKQWIKDWVGQAEKLVKSEGFVEGWKRCQADFDNYRKRQDERMKELGIIVKEDVVMQLLPVLDNFQISVEHVPEDQKKNPWVTGMMHIQRQLESVLKDNGIKEIEAKAGDIFNPEIHEAVENHQKEENEEQHKVKKVVSKGYKIGDKLIRAVKVIVE